MLFLIQHGEAMTEAEHPARPLTARGRGEVEQVAAWLAHSGLPRPREIWHSGKRRAEETAQVFAQALALEPAVRAMDGLAPNDAILPIARNLGHLNREVMIVGHLPFLSRLASWLVADREEPPIVRFRMGGVVGLEQEHDRWVIVAVITPEMVCKPC
ncbi:MAG: phosphohistidine phosphatase SixA [Nitrospirae bacterium]|nr:MAG: phosphohistidine phosphatase SixA [Nitrospirota bacterium]